jgi:hypothetical protein
MPQFNIAEFKANISQSGILQNNKFSVFFPIIPRVLLSTFTNTLDPQFTIDSTKNLQFRAESASIPGISIQTADVRVLGTGITQKMPFNAVFPDISVTFLADSKDDVYKYFYSWMNNIVDFGGTFNFLSGSTYEINYKSDYACDLYIFVYDNQGNLVKQVVLKDAFPDSITEIPLDWNDNNKAMKFTVKFAYREWSVFGLANMVGSIINGVTGLFSGGGSPNYNSLSNEFQPTYSQTPAPTEGSFGFVENTPTISSDGAKILGTV